MQLQVPNQMTSPSRIGPSRLKQLAKSEMLTTHRMNPLPAYDYKGNLIQPIEYHAKLRGVIVRATVTLKHWNIAAKWDEIKGCDAYTADIINLRILVPT